MRRNSITKLVLSALLCAIGILIPMLSPIRIILEPASFTLGSHVAIMIAMFISPSVAVAVSLGTTVGFFFGGFPIVVVLRALMHVIFALSGALILQKIPDILKSWSKLPIFVLFIGIVHAVSEVAVVSLFYFGQNMSQTYYAKGFVTSVILLVGVGTVIHSSVDFAIALGVWKVLNLNSEFRLHSYRDGK